MFNYSFLNLVGATRRDHGLMGLFMLMLSVMPPNICYAISIKIVIYHMSSSFIHHCFIYNQNYITRNTSGTQFLTQRGQFKTKELKKIKTLKDVFSCI